MCVLFYTAPAWSHDACAGKMIGGKDADGKSHPIALSPAWSDERILQALKFDVKDAKITRSLGPDGFGMLYEYSDTKVSIGHSLNDGITVTFYRPKIYVIWELGSCES